MVHEIADEGDVDNGITSLPDHPLPGLPPSRGKEKTRVGDAGQCFGIEGKEKTSTAAVAWCSAIAGEGNEFTGNAHGMLQSPGIKPPLMERLQSVPENTRHP